MCPWTFDAITGTLPDTVKSQPRRHIASYGQRAGRHALFNSLTQTMRERKQA
jgi:hypothetical protein